MKRFILYIFLIWLFSKALLFILLSGLVLYVFLFFLRRRQETQEGRGEGKAHVELVKFIPLDSRANESISDP